MTTIKINAITVPAGSGDELAHRFAARAGAVDGADGFEGFELLKPTDDREQWLVITRWRDEDVVPGLGELPRLRRGAPLGRRASRRRRAPAGLDPQRGVELRDRRRLDARRLTRHPPNDPTNDEGPVLSDRASRSGGGEGTRTPDPLHAMQVRYQLRHTPANSSYFSQRLPAM